MSFQAIAWHGADEENETRDYEYRITVFGRDGLGRSVALTTGFTPFFFVRVPHAFGTRDQATLMQNIRAFLSGKDIGTLVSASKVTRRVLHGFTNDEMFPFVRVVFSSHDAAKKVASALRYGGVGVPHVRSNAIRLYDTQIDPVLRFMHVTGVESTGWISTETLTPVPEDRKRTTCALEYEAPDYRKIQPAPVDASNTAPFVTCCYDIETYSPDGSFPNPLRECPIIQIGLTAHRYGSDAEDRYLLALGACGPIEGATVECFDTEADLLRGFETRIRAVDPDVLVSYNGWGFDDRYVAVRAQKTATNVHFRMGRWRPPLQSSSLETKRLSSSALGDNTYEMLEMVGRIPMDLMQVLKKDTKLDSYSLNNASKVFLNDAKHDLSPAEMFDKYRVGTPDALAEIGAYCVQDTRLPIHLIQKLCILPNQIEMARACWVPLAYLGTRGQQIKVFSQLARAARDEQRVIEDVRVDRDDATEPYKGATVLTAQTGAYLHDIITCLDFASLYPSIMRAYNLCHSTLVVPGSTYDNLPGVEYEDFDVEGRTVRFVQNRPGILPRLLEKLAANRKAAKREMAAAADRGDSFAEAVYNGKQLAFKISMNSIYGFCGSPRGMLPCLDVSATTTAIGRQMIEKTKAFVESEYRNARVVYGDSVMPYTPVLVRDKITGCVSAVTIESLATEWEEYDAFKAGETNRREKEQGTVQDLEAWTDGGWADIRRVVRHECPKKIYRVVTHTAVVDVTEDHSLLSPEGVQIKPSEACVRTRLMHGFPDVQREKTGSAWGDGMEFTMSDPLSAQRVYLVLKRRGLCVSVTETDGSYHLGAAKEGDPTTIRDIRVLHERYDGLVYDIETSRGTFQAGVGEMIVKNTDSVFVNFRVEDPDPVRRMEKAFQVGEDAATRVTATFKTPIELEFEKCYSPLLLFSKKRYVGNMFTPEKGPAEPKKEDAKGIQIVRRDNPPYVKQVLRRMMTCILRDRDVDAAIEVARESAARLLARQVPVEDLVLSKTLRDAGSYKDPEHAKRTQPHLAVTEKIRRRSPGSEPRNGDRVPYVFVETFDPRETQGVKAEDPTYARDHDLPIDAVYYYEHQLMSPITSMLSLFIEDPRRDLFGKQDDELKKKRTDRLAEVRHVKKLETWAGENQRSIYDFFKK